MAKKVGGLGGTFHTVKLFSPGTLLANIEGKKDWTGYCGQRARQMPAQPVRVHQVPGEEGDHIVGHIVPWTACPCGKRGFDDQHDAEKALGRARTARNRAADRSPTRRGMKRESRHYYCEVGDVYHLTEMSQSDYRSVVYRDAA